MMKMSHLVSPFTQPSRLTETGCICWDAIDAVPVQCYCCCHMLSNCDAPRHSLCSWHSLALNIVEGSVLQQLYLAPLWHQPSSLLEFAPSCWW